MASKKVKKELSFLEVLLKLKNSGIKANRAINHPVQAPDELLPVSERVQKVIQIVGQASQKANTMIYFIMYDIENNKVRTYIAKYLIKKGCYRVQKSIFLANTERKVYHEIYQTLKEVQEVYDNNDSIFFVPVSSDELRAMKMVGLNIDFDMVLGNKNTLFF